MSQHSRARASRSFRPTMIDQARLEPRLVLDASSIPAEVAAAEDAKAAYKAALADWKQDYISFKQDVIIWKLDKITLQNEQAALRDQVRAFNDKYHPKLAVLKFTNEFNPVTQLNESKTTLELDLTGVVASVLGNAKNDASNIQDKADQLQLEAVALEARVGPLQARGKDLQARRNELYKLAVDFDSKKQIAVADEGGSQVPITDFSDPELDALAGFDFGAMDDMNSIFMDIQQDVLLSSDDEYQNGSGDDPGPGGLNG